MDQTYKVLLWSGASIDGAASIRTAPINIRVCAATVDITGLLGAAASAAIAAAVTAAASATWAPINGADPAPAASVNVAGALSVAG